MNKKEEILTIALSHFSQNGYENTSLESIAQEINITKAAIYYHFKNKKELYNQIFMNHYKDLKFDNDLKEYIYKMGTFFMENPKIAKLFAKELGSEMEHLEVDTIKIVSNTLRTLSKILQGTEINPFFIQTLIVSSFTTYAHTLTMREKISDIVQSPQLTVDFNVIDEIYTMVNLYIKEKE
jgi:AcrR family transcriptional regulator